MTPRLASPRSSFADLLGLGGTVSSPCYLLVNEVSWEEFKTAFRGHHILAGILDHKLNEFLAINQGSRTVLQYAQSFNDLCQYAGYHADSDEKKSVAELPELFQLKCPSPALEARPHLNGNNPSIPRI
jgi:hypothetical protein